MRRRSDATVPAFDARGSAAWLSFGRSGVRIGSRIVRVHRGVGSVLALGVLVASGVTGAHFGGHLEQMRVTFGSPLDIAARTLGFSVNSVSLTGLKELREDEVFAAARIPATAALPFLDVNAIRARLRAVPLIADASVRKLYPDRLAISVVEREAFALWQQDGQVNVVSADGTVIDALRDERFLKLPHVVGPGANLRAAEYAALLDGAPTLRGKIRAGVLVSERRWTLKMINGIDVKLPEEKPLEALRLLAALDRDNEVLDRDVILVDMRVPGRVAFRLTEEAAAVRHEMLLKKLPKIKGRA